jgi:hypothetical protein
VSLYQVLLCYVNGHNAECHIVMLSVIMQSVVMPSVVIPSAIMLNVRVLLLGVSLC